MTELWSLSPIYHKLEHKHLVYQEASDILESLFGKPRKYSSYKDFFDTVFRDNSLYLRITYHYPTKNPRLKIKMIKETPTSYCRMYIRAPSDVDCINILKLHLLIFEVVSEDSQTNSSRPSLYDVSSDGAVVDISHTNELYRNEEISEQLYYNIRLLYTYICNCWITH